VARRKRKPESLIVRNVFIAVGTTFVLGGFSWIVWAMQAPEKFETYEEVQKEQTTLISRQQFLIEKHDDDIDDLKDERKQRYSFYKDLVDKLDKRR